MAFCNHCGTNLNGLSVCPNCGASVEQNMVKVTPRNERTMALAELDNVIRHFGEVKEDYNRFVADCAELDSRKKRATLSWLFAAPLIWIGGLLLTGVLPIVQSEILFLFYLLALLLLPIVLPIRAKIKNAKAIKRLNRQADELMKKVLDHYYSYEGEMPVGFEYYNGEMLTSLRNMLTSGRATNIPQAINLLLDDQHKQILELRALITQNAAESAAAYSKDASKNARAAAKSASRAEFYAAGTYFGI